MVGKMDRRRSSESYTPKTILLTGGAGFIGSHVARLLVNKYPSYRVVVLDKMEYCASEEHLKPLMNCSNFKFVLGDIRSKNLVDYLLREERIDTIMHFAASTHVDNSFETSIGFTSNNVVGTHVLLEAAREYGGIKRFIHVSTDEVYGSEGTMQTENSILAPTNPYACTKAAAEFICRAYLMSFGLPIVMTRGNNVYGPHQFPDKLISKSVCLLLENQKAFVHGEGSPTRNYVYVSDCARAFDIILHHGVPGDVYNIGSEQEKSNLDVVRDLVRCLNLDVNERIVHVEDRAFNDARYHIDSTKLQDLGWKQEVSWEEGLKRTVEWYRNPKNLQRWPNWRRGLVPHPRLVAHPQVDLQP